MSWNQAELDALRRAYAQGALEVEFNGRRVRYENGENLMNRIRVIEREMAGTGSQAYPVAGKAGFVR